MQIIEIKDSDLTEKPTTLTVGELRKILENKNIPDSAELVFDIPYELKEIPKHKGNNAHGFGIKTIEFSKANEISGDELIISPSGPVWY